MEPVLASFYIVIFSFSGTVSKYEQPRLVFFISLSLCVVHIPYLAASPDKPCNFGRASKTTPLRRGNR